MAPTREDYIFNGWTVIPVGAYDEDTNKVIVGDSNITLTAKWVEANPSYRLIINPKGGVYNDKNTSTVVSLKKNETYELGYPTKEGYAFTGWKSNVDGVYDAETNVVTMGNQEIELEAQWEELPKYYNLIINPNGGIYDGKATETVIEVLEHTDYEDLLTPTYEGFEFLGWEALPANAYNSENNKVSISDGNVSLTAKWKDLDEERQIEAGNVARINKTYYSTISDAVAASTLNTSNGVNDVVHVITDTTEDVINNNDGVLVTLDLEKHTVTGKITNNNKMVLKNGNIVSNSGNVIENNGTLSILSGSYLTTSGVAITNNGALTLGKNDGVVYVNEDLTVVGDSTAIEQNGTFYFYDGSLEASTGLDGDFDAIPNLYSIYIEHIESTGKQKVYPAIVNDSSVAKITRGVGKDYYYAHLQDAINNAEKWEVPVYTIRNFIASYEVKVDRNKEVEIILTNGTPTFSSNLINDGTLKLSNGTIVLNNNKIINNRNLTLTSFSVSGGTLENYGKVTVDSSVLSVSFINHSTEELTCDNLRGPITSITNDANGFTSKNCNVTDVINTSNYSINGGNVQKVTNSGVLDMTGITLKARGVGVSGGTVRVYESEIGGYTLSNKLTLFDNVSDLVIKDSTLSTTGCYSRDTCYAINGGKLEMENTTIANGSQNVNPSIYNILADSKITGGTITNLKGTGINTTNSLELNDVTINAGSVAIYSKGNITINGGEYVSSSSHSAAIVSGTINGGTFIGDYYSIYYDGTQELTINDAEVVGTRYGLYVASNGTVNIKGGTYKVKDPSANLWSAGIEVYYYGGRVVVDTSEENKALGKQTYIEGYNGIIVDSIYRDSSTPISSVVVKDAKVVGVVGYGIFNRGANAVIGVDDSDINDSVPEIIGDTYGVYIENSENDIARVEFYDGVVKGQTDSFFSYPNQIPDSSILVDSSETIDEKEYTVTTISSQSDFLQVGNETFGSFADALEVIDSTGTIKVIDDAIVGHDFEISNEKNITIDFNDHTLTFMGSIINNGNLTLKDSVNNGTLNIDSLTKDTIVNKGDLSVISGSYKTSKVLISNEANVNVSGGKFELLIDGKGNGMIINSTSVVVIDDGEFVVSRDPNIQKTWEKQYYNSGYKYYAVYGGQIEFNGGTINGEPFVDYSFVALYTPYNYSTTSFNHINMTGGTINLDFKMEKYNSSYDKAALGGNNINMTGGTININGPEDSYLFGIFGIIRTVATYPSGHNYNNPVYVEIVQTGLSGLSSGTINVRGSSKAIAVQGIVGSTIEDANIYSDGICFHRSNGTITINSGEYVCKKDGFSDMSDVVIEDGTFDIKSNGFDKLVSLTINGGDFTIGNNAIANVTTITLTDGIINSQGSIIYNETGVKEIIINGGTYESNTEGNAIDTAVTSGKLTFNGGTITALRGSGIKIRDFTMGLFDNEEDGEPDADTMPAITAYLDALTASVVNIGSGKITSQTGNGVTVSNGSLTIGIDDADVYDDVLEIIGKKNGVLISDKSIINFYDGVLKGVEKAYDGVIYGLPDGYTIVDDLEDVDDDTYNVVYLDELGDFLKVGRMTYNNFAEAIEDIAGTGTIELLTSAPVNTEVVFPEGKNITLDLKGNSLMLRKAITNKGTLTITADDDNSGISSIISVTSGKMSTNTTGPIVNSSGATLNIEKGTYTGIDMLITNVGTLNISGGIFNVSNSVDTISPVIITNNVSSTSNVNITGGKFVSKYYIDPDENVYYYEYEIDGKTYGYWSFKSSNHPYIVYNGSYGFINLNISNAEIVIEDNNVICNDGDSRLRDLSNYNYCPAIQVKNINAENLILNTPDHGISASGTIKNSTINAYRYAINGDVTVESTSINVEDNNAIKGAVNLTDVDIRAKNTAVDTSGGNIYSGKIVSTEGIAVRSTGTISIGKKDDVVDNSNLSIVGDTYGLYNEKITNFYDGVIKGRTDAYYGEVANTESNANIYQDIETIEDEEYFRATIKELGYTILNVTQNVKSKSLKTAFETANAGDELKLLDDFQLYEDVTVTADKEFSLDLDGHNFEMNHVINNYGNITIKDSSEEKGIYSYYNGCFSNYNTLTLNGINVINKNSSRTFVRGLYLSSGDSKFNLSIINSNIDASASTSGEIIVPYTNTTGNITIIGSTLDVGYDDRYVMSINSNTTLSIQDSVIRGYVSTGSNVNGVNGNIKDSTISNLLIYVKNADEKWELDNVKIVSTFQVGSGKGKVNVKNSNLRYVSNLGVLNIDSTNILVDAQELYDEDPSRKMAAIGGTAIENKGDLNISNSNITYNLTYVPNNSTYSSTVIGVTARPIFNTFVNTTYIGSLTVEGTTFNFKASKASSWNHLNDVTAIVSNSPNGFVSKNNIFNITGDSIYNSLSGNATIDGDHGVCGNNTYSLFANTGNIDISNSVYENCSVELEGATINSNGNSYSSSGNSLVIKTGTFNSVDDTIAGNINNSASVTFDNVDMTGTFVNNSGSTLNFNSGKIITNNSYAINNSGTLNFGIFDGSGTAEADVSLTNPRIESSSYTVYGSGTFNYYDGEIYSKYTPYSKSPDSVETNYEPVLYYDLDTGYYHTKLEYVYSTSTKYVASANNVKYTSLPLAINKASGVITLLTSLDEDISVTRGVTINLNGFTINGQINVKSGNSLTLLNGKVVNKEGTAIINNGSLTLGSNDGEVSDEAITVMGSANGIESHGTLSFYDGIIYGEEEAVVGDIAYVAKAHTEKKGTSTVSGKDYKTLYLTDAIDFVQVGGNTYNSLKEAFDSVPYYQGNMDDVTVVSLIGNGRTDESFTITGKNVMFDLNGYTLYSGYTISVNGPNFVLTDSSATKTGRVVTTSSSYAFSNSSVLRIEGGTYSGIYGIICGGGQTYVNNAKFDFDVSTGNSIYALSVSGNTTVTNSNFKMKNTSDSYMNLYAIQANGYLTVTDTDILIETSGTNSAYTYGIYGPTFLTMEDVNITINNSNNYVNAYGVYTYSGSNSTNDLKNIIINIDTSNASGGYNYGAYLYGSTVTIDNIEVTMNNGAAGVYGVYLSNSGEHVVKNSKIDVTRDGNTTNSNTIYGLYTSSGKITIDNVDIKSHNVYSQAYGLYTYGQLNMKDCNIISSAGDGYVYGIYSSSSSPADIDNVTVDVDVVGPFNSYKSSTSYGIYVYGGTVKNSDVNINDLAPQAYVYGVYGNANFIDTKVYAKGVNVYGVYFNNSNYKFEGGAIEIEDITPENEAYSPSIYATYQGYYLNTSIKSTKYCISSYGTSYYENSTIECGSDTYNGNSSASIMFKNVNLTADTAFRMYSGTINFIGGSITARTDAIYFVPNSSNSVFNIGTLDDNVSSEPVIVAGRYGVYKGEEAGQVNFYDGVIKANEDVIIGEFDAFEAEKELTINTEEIDGKTFKVTSFVN